MASFLTREMLLAVRERFSLDWHGIHGVSHWARVRLNGLAIAKRNGARTDVVELFAFLHDSCRENDGYDPEHGLRATEFAATLRGSLLTIDDCGFALLERACATHSDGHLKEDVTVQTCWDADRLDLWRVWVTPNPRRLATEAARDASIYAEAKRRSLAWRD